MAKKQTKEVLPEVKDITKEDVSSLVGKSAKIRYYISKGYSRSEISNHMGIRYQHVRNVEVTLLKKDMK